LGPHGATPLPEVNEARGWIVGEMLPAVASPAKSGESTWACACRTPFRSRSRRTPGRPRVRGPQDRAARERVLGCSRSPLPV